MTAWLRCRLDSGMFSDGARRWQKCVRLGMARSKVTLSAAKRRVRAGRPAIVVGLAQVSLPTLD
jgi:hypothetical protein